MDFCTILSLPLCMLLLCIIYYYLLIYECLLYYLNVFVYESMCYATLSLQFPLGLITYPPISCECFQLSINNVTADSDKLTILNLIFQVNVSPASCQMPKACSISTNCWNWMVYYIFLKVQEVGHTSYICCTPPTLMGRGYMTWHTTPLSSTLG